MAEIAKKLDAKGRLVLGPEYANATVLVEQVGDGEFRIRAAVVVPVKEAWLFKNKQAFDLVHEGLEQAKKGKTVDGPLQKNASWIDKLED